MWPILEFGLLFEKIQHVVVSNNMQISFCLKLSCVLLLNDILVLIPPLPLFLMPLTQIALILV